MPRFRVTPRARKDLQNIGRYTERHWSRAQRNSCLKDLERRFAWLADNPRLGKHRSDIHDSYYSFPQGEHVVFYLIGLEGIDVIGIPHKQMDIISYFPPDCADLYMTILINRFGEGRNGCELLLGVGLGFCQLKPADSKPIA